jgi:glycosyltransferase involved in cell wall biosynthesis
LKTSIIIPTLNEERTLTGLFKSVPPSEDIEIIVVDGGSRDNTVEISKQHNAIICIEDGLPEFPARNRGVKLAQGELLLFTTAKTRFHKDTFQIIHTLFRDEPDVIAVSSPAKLIAPPLWGLLEYALYDHLRIIASRLGVFSTSTNFLCIRRDSFRKTKGFPNDVNGDGLMGKLLVKIGKVKFYPKPLVSIDSRRLKSMGFMGFNLQFIYVIENFLPFIGTLKFFKTMKNKLNNKHLKLHRSR